MKVDLRDFKRLTRDLENISKKALPYAIRNALNDTAFAARGLWQDEMGRRFVLRNNHTTRTIGVEKASLSNLRSVVRSPLDYVALQEEGGTTHGSVPTRTASGEGRGSAPRKRLVRQPNKLGAIALGQRYRRGDRKQRNAVALHMAAATGKRFVFLDLGKRKGLFRVSGGKRSTMLDMIWATGSKTHTIHAQATLAPALARVQQQLPNIATKALVDQLKKHRVFGY